MWWTKYWQIFIQSIFRSLTAISQARIPIVQAAQKISWESGTTLPEYRRTLSHNTLITHLIQWEFAWFYSPRYQYSLIITACINKFTKSQPYCCFHAFSYTSEWSRLLSKVRMPDCLMKGVEVDRSIDATWFSLKNKTSLWFIFTVTYDCLLRGNGLFPIP